MAVFEQPLVKRTPKNDIDDEHNGQDKYRSGNEAKQVKDVFDYEVHLGRRLLVRDVVWFKEQILFLILDSVLFFVVVYS